MEAEKMGAIEIFAIFLSSSLCLYFFLALIRLVNKLWWTPIRIQHQMRSQGITGPSYRFVCGSTKKILNMRNEATSRPMDLSNDILSKVQPHVHSWINKYGNQKKIKIKNSNFVLVNFTIFDHFSFSYIPPLLFGAGKNYLQWYGTQPQLVITEPELIKEIMNNRDKVYPKEEVVGYVKKLFGDGLAVTTEGEKWAKMKKLANHAFQAESLKVISYLL